MSPDNRYARTQRAMFDAPAHATVEALLGGLATSYGARGGDLLLVDYRLATLRPLIGNSPSGLDDGPAGAAFTGQRVVAEETDGGVALYLPVTARGDRVGVLVVDLPEGPDPTAEDELAALAVCLAHDLRAADTITDRYRAARRGEQLTLAAEMQWQLLPARAVVRDEFTLAGQLEPAYAVRGDNFDWASSSQELNLTVTNGMGDGIRAAMLTNLAVYALRNARLAGGRLADQASLADQAIYAEHAGSQHLSTLLLRFDLRTGRVTAIDAGSPWLLRVRGDRVEQVPLEAQLPLGMFDGTVYVEQEFVVQPGDRLLTISDGLHSASIDEGPYGGGTAGEHSPLVTAILASRHLPPDEAVRAILTDHRRFRGQSELDDDAAVVCIDWTGKSG